MCVCVCACACLYLCRSVCVCAWVYVGAVGPSSYLMIEKVYLPSVSATLLSYSVKLLRQSGLLKHWEKKWWPKQSCSGIPLPESHKITLMDAQSAFYLLVVGITVAAVVLFGEKVRKQANKHPKTENGSQNGDVAKRE